MKTIVSLLFLSAVLSVPSFAQASAAMQHEHEIAQGKTLAVAAKFNATPNLGISLTLYYEPEGKPEKRLGTGSGLENADHGDFYLRIPANAELGKWKITRISYQLSGEEPVDLQLDGNDTFTVTPSQPVVPTKVDLKIQN